MLWGRRLHPRDHDTCGSNFAVATFLRRLNAGNGERSLRHSAAMLRILAACPVALSVAENV
ncbi:MAG TPA: hypothetical protein VLL05_05225 [Terriglobales bacterium]|nr:hypothetical protein [Terriglobales bacterium]